MIDPTLWALAAPRQRLYLEAVDRLGSNRKAAAEYNVSSTTVDKALAGLRKRAKGHRPAVTHSNSVQPDGPKKIFVLPDVQAKHGLDFSYLRRYGTYLMDKRPSIVVCIGDFADMESLSSYDKGKKGYEGRRYKKDIHAAKEAMRAFLGPLNEHNEQARAQGLPEYRPRLVLTLGNHEHRISRCIEEDPKLDGTLSLDDLEYEAFGWEVYPFLQTVVIEGIAFSHYFTTGVMGRPAGTAAAQLRVASMSCFSGHQQGKQIAYGKKADGSIITSIICGSCYEHEETYLGRQGNTHFRGVFLLHDVRDGAFDEMPVSLSYINSKYPDVTYESAPFDEPITQRFG